MLGDLPWVDEGIHAGESCAGEALHTKEGIGGTRENGYSGRETSR